MQFGQPPEISVVKPALVRRVEQGDDVLGRHLALDVVDAVVDQVRDEGQARSALEKKQLVPRPILTRGC